MMKAKFTAIGVAVLCISVLFTACGGDGKNDETMRDDGMLTNVSTTVNDGAERDDGASDLPDMLTDDASEAVF